MTLIQRFEASYDKARKNCEAEVERINAAWRNRTPEQIADYEAWKLRCAMRQDEIQFDYAREADQQGVTIEDMMRPAWQGSGSSGDKL